MLKVSRDDGPIGPAGIAARALAGSTLVGLELFWRDPKWWDPIVAIGMAAFVTILLAVRARYVAEPVRATGPVAHVLTVVLAAFLMIQPPTSGGALLFYGGSMLVAAWRRQCGCEMTVASNAILQRDDQIGCALFWPVDVVERTLRRRSDAQASPEA
jgi:hypothetical protein